MRRRPFLGGLLPGALALHHDARATIAAAVPLGVTHRALRFPADHGSHPDTHVEWWYVTGWLRTSAAGDAATPPDFGFQVTFFRSRTGLAESSASAFAARQLVFAHVALTDLTADASQSAGLMHDQRAGREGFGFVRTPAADGQQVVQLRDWSFQRPAASLDGKASPPMRIAVRSERFALQLELTATQPVLLQGDAGYSQKGPDPGQASHYYSEPQLAVQGRVERAGATARELRGRAWLDHEWSNAYLADGAVGWDWVGFNMADGAALMAFRIRRTDGSALWAGGSFRDPAGVLRTFGAGEVRFKTVRRWTSPRTQASYPVECRLTTPAGHWQVVALRDDQELDSRASTGSIYWEGLSALRDGNGRTVGYGYLELTGYAGRLRI
jgi:predicted secreted hydrolase